jgi:methionyl-tRNA synthetase
MAERRFLTVGAEDLDLIAQADALVGAARDHMKAFQLHSYLAAVFEVVAKANRYFANNEPWKLAKSDPARMRVVLFTTIETLRVAGVLLQPVMPAAMGKLLDLLGVAPDRRDFAAVDAGADAGRIEAPHRLAPGAALPAPSPVFPRYVEPEAAT